MAQKRSGGLFEPTLQQHTRAPEYASKPWRLGSQVYVAFFGGTLALTAIAFLNSRRLLMERERSRWILAVGLGVTLIVVVAGGLVIHTWTDGDWSALERSSRSLLRIGGRIVAVLLFFVFQAMQRSAGRLYEVRSADGAYASLWLAGVAATLGLGFLQALAMLALARLL